MNGGSPIPVAIRRTPISRQTAAPPIPLPGSGIGGAVAGPGTQCLLGPPWPLLPWPGFSGFLSLAFSTLIEVAMAPPPAPPLPEAVTLDDADAVDVADWVVSFEVLTVTPPLLAPLTTMTEDVSFRLVASPL